MGLRIMQSRAGMIGGTLTIERNAGGGTSVICSAPNGAARQKMNITMPAKTKPSRNACSSWTTIR